MESSKSRLDHSLVERGLAATRSRAKDLIERSQVKVNNQIITKAGFLCCAQDKIELVQEFSYVSRAALKLKHAIELFKLDFNHKIVADIGSSTGGFTQVALAAGATVVYAVDVGTNQLHPSLRVDSRVVSMEGVNIKDVTQLPQLVDILVTDLSFISLTKVLSNMRQLVHVQGQMVLLLKPQFEAGPERIGKNGIVSEADQVEIKSEFLAWLKLHNFFVANIADSPILGKEGNREYLLLIDLKNSY
jgi:23S rRNA (cytidine1920-2'-O)/16S rRNA (cytidine1409-2'-O)-methyltransferase